MPGSVGIATGTEIAVIDRDRRILAEGQSGEVVVRGPSITPGYLANPDANADAFFDGLQEKRQRAIAGAIGDDDAEG